MNILSSHDTKLFDKALAKLKDTHLNHQFWQESTKSYWTFFDLCYSYSFIYGMKRLYEEGARDAVEYVNDHPELLKEFEMVTSGNV